MACDTPVRMAACTFFLLLLLPATAAAVDCSAINVSPVADFQYSVSPAETAPIAVNFYSTAKGGRVGSGPVSDPIDTVLWTFGDGTSSETDNPAHTYARSSARSGEADKPFSVTLMIRTSCGRVAAVTKDIPAYCMNQSPGFTIVRPEGGGPYTAPVALSLRDDTLHADEAVTTWHYTVWDAGMTRLYLESTDRNPDFIIRNGGSYVIRQEVYKGCSNIPEPGTVVEKAIEVTGSAAADAIPMDTIPVTLPGGAAAIPVSASRTTVPAPAVQESSPGSGDLSVITSPAGAQVWVDDAVIGTSPVTLPDLAAGNHTLRLEKDGYRKKTAVVGVDAGVVSEYTIALDPDSGGIGGIVPVVAAVVIIAAGAGAAAWYLRKRKPKEPRYRDGNALFLMD